MSEQQGHRPRITAEIVGNSIEGCIDCTVDEAAQMLAYSIAQLSKAAAAPLPVIYAQVSKYVLCISAHGMPGVAINLSDIAKSGGEGTS